MMKSTRSAKTFLPSINGADMRAIKIQAAKRRGQAASQSETKPLQHSPQPKQASAQPSQVQPNISDNLMETLVAQEVERQMAQLPAKVVQFIKIDDVMVFALNRLPALYANSKRGREMQRQQIAPALQKQIEMAVRKGLAAVQSDPFRATGDWQEPQTTTSQPEQVLQELKQVLKYDQLSWENVAEFVKYRISQTARGEREWRMGAVFDWEAYPFHQQDM
jgi:hypothetical protein